MLNQALIYACYWYSVMRLLQNETHPSSLSSQLLGHQKVFAYLAVTCQNVLVICCSGGISLQIFIAFGNAALQGSMCANNTMM